MNLLATNESPEKSRRMSQIAIADDADFSRVFIAFEPLCELFSV